MKKIVLAFLMVLSIAISSFSQDNLPRKVIIGKDTLILISSNQLKHINVMLSERMMLKEVVLDIQSKIAVLNTQIVKMNKLNDDKTKLISLQQQQISDLNNLYSLAERNISVLNDEIKVQKKKKVKTFIVTTLGTALVTTTGVLLLTK